MKLTNLNELTAIWLELNNIINNIQFSLLHKRKERKQVYFSSGIQSSILLKVLYTWFPGRSVQLTTTWTCATSISCTLHLTHIDYSYTNIYHCLETLDRDSLIQLDTLEHCLVNNLSKVQHGTTRFEHDFWEAFSNVTITAQNVLYVLLPCSHLLLNELRQETIFVLKLIENPSFHIVP